MVDTADLGHGQPSAALPLLIASGNAVLRAGLQALLGDVFTIMDAVTYDLQSTVSAARRHRPVLTLVDVTLPGGAVRTTEALISEDLGRVVLLTATPEPFDDLLRALRAGASGYVSVSSGVDRLAATLLGVLRGEAALPRAAVGELLAEFQARPGRDLALPGRQRVHLTQREQEVLRLLRSGFSTSQIAHRLGVEAVTVRSHILALKHKLRSPTRKSLIEMRLPGVYGHPQHSHNGRPPQQHR
jgi:DNA-binding NarL/FixJ family response regulator